MPSTDLLGGRNLTIFLLEDKPKLKILQKDLTFVRAGQLACLGLLTTLPPQNKIEYVVKMYSLTLLNLYFEIKKYHLNPN